MAESEHQKPLPLAEQWSLKVKEDKSDKSDISIEVVTPGVGESAIAPEEIVPEKAAEIPVSNESTPAAEETTEAPGQEEAAVEEITKSPEQEETAVEESTEAPEPEETVEEDAEEKPEIKLETAPADFRFPTTNQTRHCFTRYIEYHRCIAAKGEDAPECEKFAKYYRSLCPSEWVERWNEQRENGTFPGPL